MRWGNPHTAVMLETVLDSGEAMTWRIDFLGNRGLSREILQVGQRLTLAGLESVKGPGDLLATNVLLADGTELLLGAVEPFWSGELEPAARPGRVDVLVDGLAESRGLFRVWSPPAEDWERYTRLQHSYYFLESEEERARVWSRAIFGAWRSQPYTRSALAARADWDPVDNFATRCEPEGMPRLMMNPHPFEFVDEGDRIRLRSELYDIDRIIHMGTFSVPDEVPPVSAGLLDRSLGVRRAGGEDHAGQLAVAGQQRHAPGSGGGVRGAIYGQRRADAIGLPVDRERSGHIHRTRGLRPLLGRGGGGDDRNLRLPGSLTDCRLTQSAAPSIRMTPSCLDVMKISPSRPSLTCRSARMTVRSMVSSTSSHNVTSRVFPSAFRT